MNESLPRRNVFLAMPHNGVSLPQALPAQKNPSFDPLLPVAGYSSPHSNLAYNFSKLWVQCVNDRKSHGYTHFAMMHADVSAPAGWLDALLEELGDADICSAVIAIKDERGLTTTALQDSDGRVRRLTLREIYGNYPETFAAPAGQVLLVNTGLWVCKLGDWCEEFPGFNIFCQVVRDGAGKLEARTGTEDWLASLWWHSKGLRVKATRKVWVDHWGLAAFPNNKPWGAWERDEEAWVA